MNCLNIYEVLILCLFIGFILFVLPYIKSKKKLTKCDICGIEYIDKNKHNSKIERVFCKKCKWFKIEKVHCETFRCTHPNNILKGITPIEEYNIYNNWPEELNKNNDCEWFEKKPDKKPIIIKEGKMKKGGLNNPSSPNKPKPKPTSRPVARRKK